MKLIIASNNAGKIREIKEILGEHFEEIISMREAGIDIDIEENGTTFAENAAIKAHVVQRIASDDYAALADDSGLEVDALNGAPGIYSARYAGDAHDDSANNKKLVSELMNVPQEKRGAHYSCAMVLARNDKPDLVGIGTCNGQIITQPRGEGGFGYDPYFLSDDYEGKTFAELSADEKNAVSHRKRALAIICELLEKENK